jgi:hypothetical protein
MCGKKIEKTNNPAACDEGIEFILPKKPKKYEKTDLGSCKKFKLSFHEK